MMNREEYLSELKKNLFALSADEQAEAIQYYSDYFEEASDDEKVIRELGQPAELAKTISEKFANALVKNKTENSEQSENQDKDDYDYEGFESLYFEFPKDNVNSLFMNFGAADVVAIPGDVFAVETRGISKDFMNCYLSGDGILTISNTRRLNLNFWNHQRRFRIVPRILVTIPSDADLERVRLSVGAGNFTAKDIVLKSKYANIDVGAGCVVLSNLYGGKVNFRCGMGSLKFKGTIKGVSNIDCGMGSINLKLDGKASDYSFDAKIGLGDFKFDGEKRSGFAQKISQPERENHFSVNVGMGTVKIGFNK